MAFSFAREASLVGTLVRSAKFEGRRVTFSL
jgi:hypothetical protein